MPSRRSHPKSRLGCFQCKARRVKCDEQRPVCGNCDKRNSDCSYELPDSVNGGNGGKARGPRSCSSQNGAGFDPLAARPSLSLVELRLMHQWTLCTCKTLSNGDVDLDWFQTGCSRAAVEHTYLLNSIFAFTSLHLATLEPNMAEEYGKRAVAYHGHALAEFREVLVNPNPEHFAALFWASIAISITAFALPRIHPPSAVADEVETLINLSRLLAGCSTIFNLARDTLGDDWTKSFPGYPRPESTKLKPKTEEMLEHLRKLALRADASEQHADDTRSALYGTSVHMLVEFFEIVERGKSQVLAWPEFVGVEFIDRLEQGDVTARLITLAYGVLLLALDRLWWAAGAGRQLVKCLAPRILSDCPQESEMAQWALAEAGL